MKVKPKLPEKLYAAYDWTDAAGELDELASLTGLDLIDYCHDSAANAVASERPEVMASDLEELAEWLRVVAAKELSP